MLNSKQVADFMLCLFNQEAGDLISNLKLQKLVYYVQGFHLAIFEAPLFDESIKAWKHGPVVEQLYHSMKQYGDGAIPAISGEQAELLDIPFEKKRFIAIVFSHFGGYSAYKLSQMTHSEMPWLTTVQNQTIENEKIIAFFKTHPSTTSIKNSFLNEENDWDLAAALLQSDYDLDQELTVLTLLDSEPFYEAS